ncbi:hypothetical protein pb186bvf_011447 [Paramecium bursaria]
MNNVRQSSKTRILLQLIDQYDKSPKDESLLLQSKLNSIVQIEKRFRMSEINKKYIFPRVAEMEEIPIKNNNFSDLLKRIYLSNQKKMKQQEEIKLTQQKRTLINLSSSQNRLLTETSKLHNQSPDSKQLMTSRSISTQLLKYIQQQKRKLSPKRQPTYQTCKSFELREKFNLSPQLLNNKSLDFSKLLQKNK